MLVMGCWVGSAVGMVFYPDTRSMPPIKLGEIGFNLWLLMAAISSYTLLIAAYAREGGKATLRASGLTLFFYFLNIAVIMSPDLRFLRPFSVFHYHFPQLLMEDGSLLIKNGLVLGAVIVDETQLRHVPDLEAAAEFRAQESACAIEPLEHRLRAFARIEQTEIDTGNAKIARQVHGRQRDALQPRILGLEPEQFAQRAQHLIAKPLVASELPRHRKLKLRVVLVERAGDFDALVALDLVADLDVVVVLHADAAFGSGTNFVDVVLEAAQ